MSFYGRLHNDRVVVGVLRTLKAQNHLFYDLKMTFGYTGIIPANIYVQMQMGSMFILRTKIVLYDIFV